jgi:beta-1,4-N-acetylglucosaminyltransferase
MKIFFYASQGGHFNEAMMIVDAVVKKHEDITMITFDSPEMKGLMVKSFLLKKVTWSDVLLLKSALTGLVNVPRILIHMIKNRPDVVISTGSGELAIPALIMAEALGINTIYIETWTRVKNPSWAGRVLYHFADRFLVQWEDLLPRFGARAEYRGGLL